MGLLEAFITLFVIMDPIGNIPLFVSMIKGMPQKDVRSNVNRSVFVAGVLLFVFLFFGIQIFELFSININSFQIAGGIILLILGIIHVLGTQHKFVKSDSSDLSVPIGTPLLTGPGVIATIIILVNEFGIFIAVAAAIMTLLATWLILANSSRLYKFLGAHWTNIISRVMGIIIAAIAVEFITKGILSMMQNY